MCECQGSLQRIQQTFAGFTDQIPSQQCVYSGNYKMSIHCVFTEVLYHVCKCIEHSRNWMNVTFQQKIHLETYNHRLLTVNL